jgi:hypothetical protein
MCRCWYWRTAALPARIPNSAALLALGRREQVHSTSAHRLGFGWRSYNPAPKSMHQQMLATKGLTVPPPFDESVNYNRAG